MDQHEESSTSITEAVDALHASQHPGDVQDSDDSYHFSDEDDEKEILCLECNKMFSGIIPYKQHKKSQSHKKAARKKKLDKQLKKQKEDSNFGLTDSDEEDLLSYLVKPYAVCQPCRKEFTAPESYKQHIVSKAHKKQILEEKVRREVSEDGGEINDEALKRLLKKCDIEERKTRTKESGNEDENSADWLEGSQFECKDCCKEFSGLVPYTQHLTSKKHAKKLEQIRMLQNVVCGNDESSLQRTEVENANGIQLEDGVLICRMCKMSFSGPESAAAHAKSRGHAKKMELQKFLRKREQDKLMGSRDDRVKPDVNNKDEDGGDIKESDPAGEFTYVEKNEVPSEHDVTYSAGAEVNASNDVGGEKETSSMYQKYKKLIDDVKSDIIA